MNTLKFRAWHKGQNVMLEVGDDYGTTHDLDCCVYHMQGQNVELMQFTGLLDRNGVEIFEGDIVELKANKGKYVTVIIYDAPQFKLKENKTKFFDHAAVRLGLVIGNVHQHPELLEANSNE